MHHPPSPGPIRRRRAAAASGFTLLETMLALTIIGVGIVAIINAQRHFLINNLWSTHASSATYLANEIREMSRGFPRHDRFSGGIYLADPADVGTFTGWGPEAGETEITDIDDLDDLDGAVFGDAATLPPGFTMTRRYTGPINGFSSVIPETLWDGTTETVEAGGESVDVAMRGWTQCVTVEKLDPFDYSVVVPDDTRDTAGATVIREVDEYPVRVTVTILYQGVWDDAAPAVTSVSWIVTP